MGFDKNKQPYPVRKASKRVLLGETREEEAARLEREIAAHPVTRCEPDAQPFLIATRLEQQAVHSAFRADSR